MNHGRSQTAPTFLHEKALPPFGGSALGNRPSVISQGRAGGGVLVFFLRAVAAVDDLGGGEPFLDELVAGGGAAELEAEVVELVEEALQFADLGFEAGGEGFAFADAHGRGGDELLVIGDVPGEGGDGGGSDAAGLRLFLGGCDGGIGAELVAFFQKLLIPQTAPTSLGEIVFRGERFVPCILGIGHQRPGEGVRRVFEFNFLTVLVRSAAGDAEGLLAGVVDELDDKGSGEGDFLGEPEGRNVAPDGGVLRFSQKGDAGAEAVDLVVLAIIHTRTGCLENAYMPVLHSSDRTKLEIRRRSLKISRLR